MFREALDNFRLRISCLSVDKGVNCSALILVASLPIRSFPMPPANVSLKIGEATAGKISTKEYKPFSEYKKAF